MADVIEKLVVESRYIAPVNQAFYLRFSVTLLVVLKDWDVFQMQEDPGAPIGKLIERNQRRMSQTISHGQADDQFENSPPINDNCSWTKKEDKEGEGASRSAWSENSVERMLVVSLAVKLEKIRGWGKSADTDEFIKLLHQENFNLLVFKQMIKNSGDCQESFKM